MVRWFAALLSCSTFACQEAGGHSAGPPHDASAAVADGVADNAAATPWQRDWARHPAIAIIDQAPVLYAISDVHGGYDRLVELLTHAGLVDGAGRWAGGAAVLVVVGDSIDKGDQSLATIAFWQALEPEAEAAGGRVVTLLGNHEAELLADPGDAPDASFVDELAAVAATPADYVATTSVSGRFLRSMPLAAEVAGWFFVHAGTSGGRDLATLASAFEDAVNANRWDDPSIVGADSPLEARDWWSDAAIARDLAATGARHLVMGHDPHAFDEDGHIGAHYAGRLVHIDTGMSPAVDLSKGRLLRVDAPGTDAEQVWSVSHSGAVTAIDMEVGQ